jgi:hypothetical protein
MRRLAVLMLSMAAIAAPTVARAGAGRPSDTSMIVGAWTLNKNLSDPSTGQSRDQSQGDNPARRGGGGGRGGRRGRGGSGGFGGGGGGFGRAAGGNPDDVRRRTEAVRAIMEAPEGMTITQTDSLVIIVGEDGRTTRLSPDGKKIKDDATGIERRTKWDGDKLTSEITGAGPGKITESYAVDPDGGRLNVTLQVGNSQASGGRVIHRVYDRVQNR